MKKPAIEVEFVCDRHDVNLRGTPILIKGELEGSWTVSPDPLYCPKGTTAQVCKDDWHVYSSHPDDFITS